MPTGWAGTTHETVLNLIGLALAVFSTPASAAELSVHGFADIYFSVDWLRPSPDQNRARFAHRAYDLEDGISLGLAGLDLQWGTPTMGLQIDLRGGLGARRLLGFAHQQDLSFVAPGQLYGYWSNERIAVDFGLFSSIFGTESVDKSWINRNGSRSVARILMQPQQHLGVRMHAALTSHIGLTILIDNGGGLQTDRNVYPSLGAQLYLSVMDSVDLYLGYYGGPTEQAAQLKESAHLLDAALDAQWGALTVQISWNLGITAPDAEISSAQYWALSGVLGYDFTDRWRVSGRIEHVNDNDRALTELYRSLSAGTLTLDFALREQLLLRAETRLENSPTRIFASSGNSFKRTWVSSSLMAVVHFE